MSKKLLRAIAEGKVVVGNKTAGEAIVFIPLVEGGEKTVIVPPYGKAELAPKHTDPGFLMRSRNLRNLLRKNLRIL